MLQSSCLYRNCVNKEGNGLGSKLATYAQITYARIGVACYVVFDPLKQLQDEDEMNGAWLKVRVLNQKKYVELSQPFWRVCWIGADAMEGTFEGQQVWLYWCDRAGQPILTGAEERELERQRADRLAER